MNTYIGKNMLHFLTFIRKQPVWQSLNFLKKSQYWTADQIYNYQELRLKELINHCYQTVPFYNSFFKENEITPSDITFESLSSLPLITKTFLRNNLQQLTSTTPTGPVETAKTSGSTGVALKFPKSLKSSAMQLAAMYRGHLWHGVDVGAKEARLWGIPVTTKGRYKVHLTDFLLNRFREKEYNLTPEVLTDFCDRIRKKKPDYLMGYTSMVVEFAKYLENEGIDGSEFGFKMVKCTSL